MSVGSLAQVEDGKPFMLRARLQEGVLYEFAQWMGTPLAITK
jgi:hypothetical protein